tara:strand:- start:4043 stop:4462 length:420 start_codon:yes stop_codon:yes gene_type:complete
MKNKEWKDVRIIGASGKPKWMGGAYTLAFVYSNKGNFLLKGYGAEIREYLERLKSKGYKFIVNETLWSTDDWTGKKHHRDIWRVSSNNTYISEPEPTSKGSNKFKWVIQRFGGDNEKDVTMRFKRLPKKWVPEFDKIIF